MSHGRIISHNFVANNPRFTIAKWLSEMVREYYQLSGCHEKTGRPFMDTLKLLGLEEFKEWAQPD